MLKVSQQETSGDGHPEFDRSSESRVAPDSTQVLAEVSAPSLVSTQPFASAAHALLCTGPMDAHSTCHDMPCSIVTGSGKDCDAECQERCN